MPKVWFALKKSLHCKSEPADVYDPKTNRQLSSIQTKKSGRSGCSRSIANLKDVIHGSKRHMDKPPSCSPRSIGSSEFLNPIAHEVILSNSRCELKITGFNGAQDDASTFVGTLRPGTPGPGGQSGLHYGPAFGGGFAATPPRKSPAFHVPHREHPKHAASALSTAIFSGNGIPVSSRRFSRSSDAQGCANVTCHKCGEQFGKWEALESHHLAKHAGKCRI